MGRAERRRMERQERRRKPNQTATVNQNVIGTALLKKRLSDQIDRELGDKYYQQACKESCDNTYYIMLCSAALALHDCNPAWGCEAIGKRLQLTMDYIDRFASEYEGDIRAYLEKVEEETGLTITVDSQPKERSS